jgi:predicted MFS family arabinose efflux permease
VKIPVPRILLTAFVGDLGMHVALGSFSYRAAELGATPGRIGLIGGVIDLVYTIVALALPRVTDAASRSRVVRCAAATMAVGGGLCSLADSIGSFVLALCVLRAGSALFWPTLEARLSDEHHADLGRAVSAFSLSWSAGKALGYGVNAVGFGQGLYGPRESFLVTAVAAALIVLVTPRDHERPAADGTSGSSGAASRSRVWAAWVGVFLACGAFIVVQNQNAPLMIAKAHSGGFGNLLLATLVAFNMLMFEVLRRRPGLAGADRGLVASGVLLFAGLGVIFLVSAKFALLAGAGLIGVGMGLAYTQSLFLSLRLPHGKSVAAGIHEAFIGIANATLAPLAGVATEAYGNANGAVMFALGLVFAGMLFVLGCLKASRVPRPDPP